MEEQLTLFNFDENPTELLPDAPEFIQNAWRKAKQDKKRNFSELQELDYEVKIERQKDKAFEFYIEMEKRGYSTHVSVGGLDSITLFV